MNNVKIQLIIYIIYYFNLASFKERILNMNVTGIINNRANGNFIDRAVKNANRLANGVQAYFTDRRQSFVIENQSMSLDYVLTRDRDQLVSYVKNKSGISYVENTLDAYVTLTDGTTVYSSKTSANAMMNIFRYGYYYYEVRFEEQVFSDGISIKGEKQLPFELSEANDLTDLNASTNSLSATVSGKSDPYFALDNVDYDADKYPYVRVTIKSKSTESSSGTFHIIAGDMDYFNYLYNVTFNIIPDGEYHSYIIRLKDISKYYGKVSGLRLDIDGLNVGEGFEISEITLLDASPMGAPTLSTARIFHTYSDKLHHVLQVAASEKTENIASVGLRTEIAANTVEKLIIKDASGLHSSLEGVDWDSAEYAGFDIKNAGIFGYILPKDKTSGKMTVTLEGDRYIITQSRTPENNAILPGEGNPKTAGTPGSEACFAKKAKDAAIGNKNDFFMGQRLYTDESHDFDTFIKEAELERDPLTENDITVREEKSHEGRFEGYDALRGSYKFHILGSDFNQAYYDMPNQQPALNLTVKGDKRDRNIYILAATKAGGLECAALLDHNEIMLPIPIEVAKNFCGDGEDNIYMLLDTAYGEAIFPLLLKEGDEQELTILHLYQNWGKFPLKQISSIQYHAPYYHLSTGVTETNCLVPWRHAKDNRIQNVLPDHRPMSAPMWKSQPQHTSGGTHTFLRYLDANRNMIVSEVCEQIVDAYGPTYADIEMKHTSVDGKIKVSYTHVEMPQTDENRAYCTMSYEFIEDINFKDFKTEFGFYNVGTNTHRGNYQQIGYLDINNEPCVVPANRSHSPIIYTMGDKCPYFSFFNMDSVTGQVHDYVNLSFLIRDAEFIIGGKVCKPHFAARAIGSRVHLTLDLDAVSFKKGDRILIHAIIMPWGSYQSIYDSKDFAPDQNVRDVRENSLINGVSSKPLTNCEAIESVFIPKVRTTNGKDAEFALAGGENNIAVRVYGFEKLAKPTVYELVDNEWSKYELSSKDTPDIAGNAHAYDGYNVYYDKDGTYSYSFIVKMSNGSQRRFKIDV